MVRHTQTIRFQQPPNYLSVFDHFLGLALKGLTLSGAVQLFMVVFVTFVLKENLETGYTTKNQSM